MIARSNSEILDEVPPHDYESELGLLSAMLLDPPIIPRVWRIVQPDMFHTVGLRAVYTAMLAVYRRTRGCHVDALHDELRAKHDQRIYWLKTLAEIAEYMPHSQSWKRHADGIVEAAKARQLRDALLAGIQRIYNGDRPTSIAISIRSALSKLVPERKVKQ